MMTTVSVPPHFTPSTSPRHINDPPSHGYVPVSQDDNKQHSSPRSSSHSQLTSCLFHARVRKDEPFKPPHADGQDPRILRLVDKFFNIYSATPYQEAEKIILLLKHMIQNMKEDLNSPLNHLPVLKKPKGPYLLLAKDSARIRQRLYNYATPDFRKHLQELVDSFPKTTQGAADGSQTLSETDTAHLDNLLHHLEKMIDTATYEYATNKFDFHPTRIATSILIGSCMGLLTAILFVKLVGTAGILLPLIILLSIDMDVIGMTIGWTSIAPFYDRFFLIELSNDTQDLREQIQKSRTLDENLKTRFLDILEDIPKIKPRPYFSQSTALWQEDDFKRRRAQLGFEKTLVHFLFAPPQQEPNAL